MDQQKKPAATRGNNDPSQSAEMLQVLEVFPDADVAHVQNLLRKHQSKVPLVLEHIAEHGYEKAATNAKDPPPATKDVSKSLEEMLHVPKVSAH